MGKEGIKDERGIGSFERGASSWGKRGFKRGEEVFRREARDVGVVLENKRENKVSGVGGKCKEVGRNRIECVKKRRNRSAQKSCQGAVFREYLSGRVLQRMGEE